MNNDLGNVYQSGITVSISGMEMYTATGIGTKTISGIQVSSIMKCDKRNAVISNRWSAMGRSAIFGWTYTKKITLFSAGTRGHLIFDICYHGSVLGMYRPSIDVSTYPLSTLKCNLSSLRILLCCRYSSWNGKVVFWGPPQSYLYCR